MQDNKTKFQTNDVETPKPKRKIVHRIIRRVPKAKPATEEVEVVNPNAFNYSPTEQVNNTPQIIKHAPPSVLADEEPVVSSHGVTTQEPELPLTKTPKDIIFKELSQSKPEKLSNSQISHTQLDSSAKNPIANIWPYIAASKQQSKDSIEIRDSRFEDNKDTDIDDEMIKEKNYFAWIPWIIIPLIVTGIVIFVLSYMAGADVTIQPKTKTLTVATDLIAEKSADQTKSIPLTVLLIEDKVTADVTATEAKTTIATASGKITVSNKQKIAQTLIKTTRFESADGKIYRIRDNIKVPAAASDKPGTIDVMVYAESAGPEYNKKDVTDFTIPGFKGKPQFQLVTARSIGAISGGSSGVKKSVSKEATEEVAKNLRIELENKLRARVERELLQNQVAYDSLYQFDYKEPFLEASDAPEKARVALSGTLAVPIFVKSDLGRELAKANIKDYVGEDITLNKIEQLSVKISDGQKANLFTDSKVSFRFDGEVKFTWNVDTKAFAKALLNISKDDITRVSKKFTGIDKTVIEIHPFWKSYFPGNVNDIKVMIVDETK